MLVLLRGVFIFYVIWMEKTGMLQKSCQSVDSATIFVYYKKFLFNWYLQSVSSCDILPLVGVP